MSDKGISRYVKKNNSLMESFAAKIVCREKSEYWISSRIRNPNG